MPYLYAISLSTEDVTDIDVVKLYKFLQNSKRFIVARHRGRKHEHPHYHCLAELTEPCIRKIRATIKEKQILDPVNAVNCHIQRSDGKFSSYLFHENPNQIVRYKGSWNFEKIREIARSMKTTLDAKYLSQDYVYMSYTQIPFVLAEHPEKLDLITQIVSEYKITWNSHLFARTLLDLRINPSSALPHMDTIMDVAHALHNTLQSTNNTS